MPQADVERVVGQRPHPHRVELLADAEVAHLVAEPERERAGAGREVQQVGRRQRHALPPPSSGCTK